MKRLITLFVLFGFLIFTFTSYVDAQYATVAQINLAIAKGLKYLRATQNANGSWGTMSLDPRPGLIHDSIVPGDVGLTGLCALAFLNHGYTETDPTVASAINYLLANVQSDGSITNGDYPTYQTSMAILPLIATGNPAYNTVISNARTFLKSIQLTSIPPADPLFGGWGYGRSEFPDPEDQGDLLIRDNPFDFGSVPSSAPWWLSPDIWVDNNSDGVPDPIIPGIKNKLHAAVHNIGATTLTNITVDFYSDSAVAGFSFPTATLIDSANIPILPPLTTAEVEVLWYIPRLEDRQQCVGVRAYCAGDPLPPFPNSVPGNNNVAIRNFFPLLARAGGTKFFDFKVQNNTESRATVKIKIESEGITGLLATAGLGTHILDPDEKADEQILIRVPSIAGFGTLASIDVTATVGEEVIGGFTIPLFVGPEKVNVSNISTKSGLAYEASDIDPDVPYYIDDDFKFSFLPTAISTGVLIRTANADAQSTGADFLTFDVDKDVTVYLLRDSLGDEERGGEVPDWLSTDFTKVEGLRVPIENGASKFFTVWKKDFSAGQVTIGGNADPPASGQRMNYVLILVTKLRALLAPDQNAADDDMLAWDVWNPNPRFTLPGAGSAPLSTAHWADLSNTQWAIMAMPHFMPPGTPWRDAAENFVENCQWLDPLGRPGGLMYIPANEGKPKDLPTGSMTYAGIWSYRLLSLPLTDPRVRGALRWVRHNYSVIENPLKGDSAYYYYCVTMAKALRLCGINFIMDSGGTIHPWYLELATELVSRQLWDGSWVNVPGPGLGEWNKKLCTAFALLTLESGVLPSSVPATVVISLTTSPLELHVYDAYGRHTGSADSGVEEGIPESTCNKLADKIEVTLGDPDPSGYTIIVKSVGTENHNYKLTITGQLGGEEVYDRAYDETIGPGETDRYDLYLSSIIGGLTIFTDQSEPVAGEISVTPSQVTIDAAQGTSGDQVLDITETRGAPSSCIRSPPNSKGKEQLRVRFCRCNLSGSAIEKWSSMPMGRSKSR